MRELVQIAQRLVKAVSVTLPFSISLSDADGCIVGATDSKRIGTFHPVYKRVIESKDVIAFSDSEASKFDNVLPGLAMPLNFQEETVGVLGIIGPPEEVRPHAELTKHYVELLWQETFYKQLADLKTKMEETYLQYILMNDAKNEEQMMQYCDALHIDMDTQMFCVVIHVEDYLVREFDDRVLSLTVNNLKELILREINHIFHQKQLLKVRFLNTDKIVLLFSAASVHAYVAFMDAFKQKSAKLLRRLAKYHLSGPSIAAGKLVDSVLTIHESYQEAEQLLKQSHRQILSYHDWDVTTELLPSKVDQAFKDRMMFRLQDVWEDKKCKEVISSFQAYCQYGMNITEAAKALAIHRNTVIYRLKKMEEITSMDTRDFQHCALLYVILKNICPLFV
ncbi:CdaR family transcriptional regulator [Virgibacillus alimentarius]|uniref:CdaR family transcriptional regulator n=1 Tax=Virgibacillus alimentarius TaxID=698769 RepID=UPI0004935EA0|nr:sugar diacid recognition domain-containing protein [Virgibacillus alimentarius]